MSWKAVFENPTEKEKTFYLRDYLVPGGRYPYERLPGDMEVALAQGYTVSLISVPGFLMVLGWPGKKKPWCRELMGGREKCFKTAREAIRG